MSKSDSNSKDMVIIQPDVKKSITLRDRCVRLMKKCWMLLAILMISMAILFSLFRALTPWAKQYKGEVERHLSLLIGQPVIIKSMETSWYWLEPVLKLNQITVLDSSDHVLKLAKLMVGINLLSSLWHWDIQPGILYIEGAHLTIRQVNNVWKIDGLLQDQQVTTLESDAYLPVLSWLLGQQKIVIKNVSARVHLDDGSILPLSALNLTAVNHQGHYRLKGKVQLAQTMETALLVLADLSLNPFDLSEASGHAFVSVHQFIPSQWHGFFPKTPYQIKNGIGDFDVWIDVLNGHLSGVQTKLDFRNILWRKNSDLQSQFIQSMQANLAWMPAAGGWKLSGDHINLRAGGIRWPENSLLVDYQQSQKAYHVFVKALMLEPLLTAEIEWPEIMQPVLAVHPRGQLHDTQLDIKDGHVNNVLSGFANLGWQAQGGYPAVSNISGVLNWQPTGGHLELDGENTTLSSKGLPPVTFEQANAAFEWKELSDGLRISMEHLVLSHPDFVLSARGAIDEPFLPSASNLRLTAEFSADHAARWLAYIPSNYLKPKLNEWLKHDIKRVDKASGQLTINGNLADFPFDQQPGEFSIVSRLSGMDLLINKDWPLISNVDLYLRVNKRDIDLDVHHATLLDIEATQANLQINDVGLGKEALLLNGHVEVPVSQLKAYVAASPLRAHFNKLKKLDVAGPVELELNLEVPLYPENTDILALGAITLKNNKATFHHALNDVQLTHLSGELAFNEHGVINSELKARLLGDPVSMHILSARLPQPYTEVRIDGDTTIDLLHKKFNLPFDAFMEGHLKVSSKITLTDDPSDLDNIQISTPLEGVAIDLPMPFGKSAEESRPLTINVDFNLNKEVRLRFNYDQRVSSDLWFASSKNAFKLTKGRVRVGNSQTPWKKQPGLQIVGSLPTFDVKQWREVWFKLPDNLSEPSMIERLQSVDMTLDNVAVWGKNYRKVAVKADKLAVDNWSIKLQQQDMAADLRYQPDSNTLSGRFSRLYLEKPVLTNGQDKAPVAHLKPMDIPNLDVTINALKLGKVDLGTVAIKSTSTTENWHLDTCNIKSAGYSLTMKGDWSLHEGQNNTHLQADIQITNLDKSLIYWQVTPVIEADQGLVQFDGGWMGAINNYSLATMNGKLYMLFKNGRITHLSKETEEKLGLGKLFSILSLQTIPRRLKLDFSDLSNPGYSFDVLKGDFILKNGVLSTSNSYIDGPVAYANMKGELDLAKRLYDVDLHISPHITASLPIVATIAGGPIAGMAAWVASKIINQGMQQVTGYTYKVSGPWLDPVVQQVSIYKKKV